MYIYCISYKFNNGSDIGFRAFNAESFWDAIDIFETYTKKDHIDDYIIINVYREELIESNPE